MEPSHQESGAEGGAPESAKDKKARASKADRDKQLAAVAAKEEEEKEERARAALAKVTLEEHITIFLWNKTGHQYSFQF